MACRAVRAGDEDLPGTDAPAVDALDLTIDDGEFLVLVGPSGSGKTTALRMLAGLEEVDAGAIFIGDREVTDLPPKRRDVAMVFQNYALYPYLTVAENIAFPLRMARVSKAERERRTHEVAQMLGLEPYLERKPGQLSGGQRQRVAMGRAIIREPSVFLMDEPLSNLDAKLRVQMRAEIAALQSRLGIDDGLRHARPVGGDDARRPRRRARRRPAAAVRHAARALRAAGEHVRRRVHRLTVDEPLHGVVRRTDRCSSAASTSRSRFAAHGAEVVVGLRPESIELASDGIPAEVEVVEELGADSYVFAAAEVGRLVARCETKHAPAARRARPACGRSRARRTSSIQRPASGSSEPLSAQRRP